MEINRTTSLNDRIRRVAKGHKGAGSVIALLVSQANADVMDILDLLDKQGVCGQDLYVAYVSVCDSDLGKFMRLIKTGILRGKVNKLNKESQ